MSRCQESLGRVAVLGTSMQSLSCSIRSAALSLAVGMPSPALLCSPRCAGTSPRHHSSARPSSCKISSRFSRAGCALPSPPAKGLPRHLRPKNPVKSLCYLLFSVVFAADSIPYLFFPLGALHFDASTHISPCQGQQSRSSCSASWLAGNLLLLVPTSGFHWGLQPCCRWERFAGRGGSELWFAVFSGAKLLLGACWRGKVSRSCVRPWFCLGS